MVEWPGHACRRHGLTPKRVAHVANVAGACASRSRSLPRLEVLVDSRVDDGAVGYALRRRAFSLHTK